MGLMKNQKTPSNNKTFVFNSSATARSDNFFYFFNLQERLSSPPTLPPELGASYGRGDGHIEAVGLTIVVEAWYEQRAVDLRHNFGRYAVALVAHHDETIRGKLLAVNVAAGKRRGVDGHVGIGCIQQRAKVRIDDPYMRYAAHGGLHHLWVKGVGGVVTAKDGGYAEPIRYPDYRAEVARILHPVEGEAKLMAADGDVRPVPRNGKQGHNLLGMLQETYFP